MGYTRIHQNCVDPTRFILKPISVYDLNLCIFPQIKLGASDQRFVLFYCYDTPVGTNQLGHNRRIIPCPTSYMVNHISLFDIEMIDEVSQKGRLAIVQLPLRINCNHDVVIDIFRMIIRRLAIPTRPENAPWTRAEKCFARHCSECMDEPWRPEVGCYAQSLSIPLPLCSKIGVLDRFAHGTALGFSAFVYTGKHLWHTCGTEESQ